MRFFVEIGGETVLSKLLVSIQTLSFQVYRKVARIQAGDMALDFVASSMVFASAIAVLIGMTSILIPFRSLGIATRSCALKVVVGALALGVVGVRIGPNPSVQSALDEKTRRVEAAATSVVSATTLAFLLRPSSFNERWLNIGTGSSAR